MLHRHYLRLAIAAGALLPLANAQGDPSERRADRGGMQDQAQAGSASRGDMVLATWLIADNEKEIALAQLAQQRAQSPEVKQFAERMVKDHEQFIQKLRPFAGGMGGMQDKGRRGTGTGKDDGTKGTGAGGTGQTGTPPAGREPTAEGKEGREPAEAGAQDASGIRQVQAGQSGQPAGALDHVALIRDLGRKCTESAKRELESKQGADFDRCYAGMAVMDHMGAMDKLTVFREYAGERLKATLAEGQSTVQQHLDHAKQLAKQTHAGKTEGH